MEIEYDVCVFHNKPLLFKCKDNFCKKRQKMACDECLLNQHKNHKYEEVTGKDRVSDDDTLQDKKAKKVKKTTQIP